jgi:endo-1,4-beta-xylanase
VDLSAATVVPGNADNKTIVWSVKNDGGTGLTTADVAGGKFTPANPGTVKLTATIANGSALGTDYAQDFDIVISTAGSFVAVTDITGVPDEGIAEQPVSLAGAVVVPDTATYQTIVWRVKSGGGLSAGNIDGNSFTPTETGSVVIEAVISSAAGNMTPFTKEFTITIKAAFTAVTGIDGLADRNAVTGTLVNLNAGLTVQPATATNKTIVWSVTTAGATGLTTSDVEGGSFTPANAGTATLTATILNGRAQGSDYTQDITLTIIKPVTAISGVPTSGTKGQSISLAGAQAEPSDASNKTIVWTVNDAGGTGVTTANLAGGTFTPANAGSLKLTATIANGSAIGTAFVNTYTITVSDPGSFTPGFDLGDDTSIQLTDSLSRELSKDTPNTVTKDSAYYVVIKGNYTDVVWRLNGNPQNVPGSLIYLPTDTLQTINLSVEGKKDGKLESSGSYTFTITN